VYDVPAVSEFDIDLHAFKKIITSSRRLDNCFLKVEGDKLFIEYVLCDSKLIQNINTLDSMTDNVNGVELLSDELLSFDVNINKLIMFVKALKTFSDEPVTLRVSGNKMGLFIENDRECELNCEIMIKNQKKIEYERQFSIADLSYFQTHNAYKNNDRTVNIILYNTGLQFNYLLDHVECSVVVPSII